jgi:hypothetical protein
MIRLMLECLKDHMLGHNADSWYLINIHPQAALPFGILPGSSSFAFTHANGSCSGYLVMMMP